MGGRKHGFLRGGPCTLLREGLAPAAAAAPPAAEGGSRGSREPRPRGCRPAFTGAQKSRSSLRPYPPAARGSLACPAEATPVTPSLAPWARPWLGPARRSGLGVRQQDELGARSSWPPGPGKCGGALLRVHREFQDNNRGA